MAESQVAPQVLGLGGRVRFCLSRVRIKYSLNIAKYYKFERKVNGDGVKIFVQPPYVKDAGKISSEDHLHRLTVIGYVLCSSMLRDTNQ